MFARRPKISGQAVVTAMLVATVAVARADLAAGSSADAGVRAASDGGAPAPAAPSPAPAAPSAAPAAPSAAPGGPSAAPAGPSAAPAGPSAADEAARVHGFVDLADVAPGIRVDVRYAGPDNFVGRPVRGYGAARCFVTRRAAAALSRAERALEAGGHRLVVYDCYRPKRAVADFVTWAKAGPAAALTPQHNPAVPKGELLKRGYIAPRSAHSRGSTVDVTLESLASELVGRSREVTARDCRDVQGILAPDGTLNMGTTFDCFDERAHVAADVSSVALGNRELLRAALVKQGFAGYDKEWWHFSLADEPYPDQAFDFEIAPRR
jgi:D-alanyl-D-alanine dipeptidase